MSSPTRPPRQKAPPLTADCHFHVFSPYRQFPLSADRACDPAPNARAFVARFPGHRVWGAGWPHPRMKPLPEAGLLLDQFFAWVPDPAARQRVLADDAATLYGFRSA